MLPARRIIILAIAAFAIALGQTADNSNTTTNTTSPPLGTLPSGSASSGDIAGSSFRNFLVSAYGNGAANCTQLTTQAGCLATVQCYWGQALAVNESTGNDTMIGFCYEKQTAAYQQNNTVPVSTSWCFQYFPAPFITSVYFLGSLLFGAACSGVVYNAKYFNVYTIVLDTGERVFNTNYYKTWKQNVYLIILLGATGILAVTTFMNWVDESSCVYIYGVFIFCAVVALPFILVPLWYLGLYIYMWLMGVVDTGVNIDDEVRPVTSIPASDPKKCQVRMM